MIAALLLATIVKLYLALSTFGSPDVLGFQDYLVKIRSLGGIGAYYAGGAYDNAPMIESWINFHFALPAM